MPVSLDDIMAELKALRSLLEASAPSHYVGPGGPQPKIPNTQGPTQDSRFNDEPVPQPSPAWPLDRAEAHCVHFGKNTDVPLRDLKDTSLAFYAKEKQERLNQYGKPFTKRPEDIDLDNAARTVWHTRRGTLAGGPRAVGGTTTRPHRPPCRHRPRRNRQQPTPRRQSRRDRCPPNDCCRP